MADVTIHDIDPGLLERLEAIDRSIPEVRTIEDLRRLAHESHERLRGRVFSDSTDLIREDRER